jgi:hypothetical protein
MRNPKSPTALRALIFAAIVAVSLSALAKQRFVPNDTLTDFNTLPTDSAEDVAVLRAMQKTHDASGKALRRAPGIRIFSIRLMDDHSRQPPLQSQHLRLKSGEYSFSYACGLGGTQLESFGTHTFAAGRRYYIYCESRNWNHYDLKITEVP